MGSVSRVHTFSSGAVLTAAQLNNEFDNLLTSSAINGGLDASNLGVTAGQVTASKALVVDSSRDLDDTSSSNQLNNLTVAGLLKTDNTTNATSTTDGSLQTDGGLSVALDAIIGDDLKLLSDSAVLSLGVGSDFTITHDGTTGATLAGNPIVIDSGDALTLDAHTGVFTFKDAGSSVLSITEGNSGDVTIKLITNGKDLKFTDNGDAVGLTVLDGAAGITVAGEGDFGSLDVNGNADISGDLTLSAGADGALRFSAASSIKILDNNSASLVVEEADNAYMTFVTTNSSEAVKFDKTLDINAAMDIDASMQIDGTITVGVDDTGYDVKFFGATSGSSVLIDESADDVIFTNFGLAVGSDATGDIYYRNSSGYLARLAAGSNGHVLTLDSGIPSWAATSSDIGGSVGSTDNAVPRANGTGGATLQASSVIIDDSNNVTGVGNLTLSGEVDAATGDFSGAVDIAGDLTLSAGADGALRFSAASSIKILDNSATSLVVEEADNAYMTFVTTNSSEAIKFDVGLDVNAAVQIDSTVTVGVDDTGHDVKFFGATSGSSVLFDESADDMILTNYGLAVGSDATGDIYYRNSSGYLARLGKGTNGHYLKQGASIPEWAAVSSGGSVAGSDSQIQYNNGGSFGGDADFTWDDTNHRVGINVTATDSLSVAGTVKASKVWGSGFPYRTADYSHEFGHNTGDHWIMFISHEDASDPYGLAIYYPNKDTSSSSGNQFFTAYDSGFGTIANIKGNGTFGSANNTYGSTSDEKLKKDIEDANLQHQYDDIKAVKLRNFRYKDRPDRKMLGVIAQELEVVSPNLIEEDPDVNPQTNENLGTTTKFAKYSVLYLKALGALQVAINKIETLEQKVAALES